VLAGLRAQIKQPDVPQLIQNLEPAGILTAAEQLLEGWMRPSLVPVINATGVILHTNLGRAPLSRQAAAAMQRVALGYSNLEFDLERGARGSRLVHAEALLRQLTGAEAAIVVNNNAAALLLVLTALAKGKRVVIARSQLVEVGGGFRIPDVMRQSGAKLVEVGTTNRVHPRDFEDALQEPAGLVMRAHHSNFRIIGFTTEPSLSEMVSAAHRYGVPLLDDLGSGVLLDTARYGLAHEPTLQESMEAGADLVCFSGDKLLGGPQAGIIIGKSALVERIKKHPLARAVRADKLCLAGLSATLLHYLKDEAEREVPIWRMISMTPAQIQARAQHWAAEISSGTVIAGASTVGGGSLPEETLPTFLLALTVRQPNRFLARLRALTPAVVARVENDQVVLDPRTVLPEEDTALLAGLHEALPRGV
jgi:L-seryl-tRNA(Ser) seleniumtransferase